MVDAATDTGKNFVTPPYVPAAFGVSVVPGAQQQYMIGADPTQLIPPPAQFSAVPPAAATSADIGAGTKLHDALSSVTQRINAGETGAYAAPGHVLFGGGRYADTTPSRPGYYGFPQTPGVMGPAGMSHAAGEAQWEPGTWKDAAESYIKAGNPEPNFRSPADRANVEKFWAGKVYKDKTGRDLAADAAAGKVDYSALASTWPSLTRGGPAAAGGRELAERVRQGYGTEAANLDKAARAALDQINGASGNIDQMMTRVRAALDKADEAQQAATRAIAKAPQNPEIDGVKHISGLATIIGIIGGALTKQPMLASLDAAGAAIEAYNAGDLRNYKISYANWKTQTDLLFKIADMSAQRARDIVTDEKLGIDEKRSLLDTTLRAAGLSQLADEARIKGDEVVLDWTQKVQAAQQSYELRKAQIDATNAYRERTLADKGWDSITLDGKPYRMNKNTGAVEPIVNPETGQQAGSVTRPTAAGGSAQAQAATAFLDESIKKNGRKPTAQEWIEFSQSVKGSATGRLSDEAAKLLAQQYEMGDPGAITSMPRAGPARIQVENRIADDMAGMDSAARQITMNRIRMAEAKAAATAAGRITMQTHLFAQEAVGAGQLVVQASEVVPRSQNPTFNRALEAFYRQEGDPKIIQLGMAINALVNAYGKLSNPTGTGIHDADKEFLRNTIDEGLSHGQIKAAVEQIIKEGQNVSSAAQSAQQEVLQNLAPQPPGASITPPIAPSAAPAHHYATRDEVKADYQAGRIPYDEAAKILREQFGDQ